MKYITVILMILMTTFSFCSENSIKKDNISEDDSLTKLKERFLNAYFKTSCLANHGIDPEVSLMPVKKPIPYMESLLESKDPKLNKFIEILASYGFSGFEEFRSIYAQLSANQNFRNEIELKFIDEIKKCP